MLSSCGSLMTSWWASSIVRTPSGSGLSFASRLAKFGLELNAEKTRLIEFGRFAARNRDSGVGLASLRRSSFLGFTHIVREEQEAGGSSSSGSPTRSGCGPSCTRSRARSATRASAHPRAGTLARQRPARALQLLRGARQQRGAAAPSATEVIRHWLRSLRRRSQRTRLTWERMGRLADRWLPRPRILHPWPEQRFDASTQGRSPVR